MKLADLPFVPTFNRTDLIFFALALKDELNISFKTLKRYVKEAYYALTALGYIEPIHSLKMLPRVVKSCDSPSNSDTRRQGSRSYCSIAWKDILS